MIEYTSDLSRITEDMLLGFFDGWSNPPSPATHMKILRGSRYVWLALDTEANKAVGFITAISDGVLSAYIPLLEVLPKYQNLGIGKTLTEKMLDTLKDLYMVDLLCDEELLGFYNKFGMDNAFGALRRNYERQNGE